MFVTSRDSTRLDVKVYGQGPPMVLVHGASVDRRSWSRVTPRLAERFTVYALDRRGRRGSTREGGPYALARETEDVAAVAEAAGGDVYVVAHSYGALCSLEAPLITGAIGRMLLYEPPAPTPGVHVALPDVLARMREAGMDERLEIFYREVILLSQREVDALRRAPAWQAYLGAAPVLSREVESVQAYEISDRPAKVDVPVRLLVGTQSPPYLRPAAEAMAARLPRADLVTLTGQGHMANEYAPRLFTDQVFAAALDGQGGGVSG